jgi:hypothetical protein
VGVTLRGCALQRVLDKRSGRFEPPAPVSHLELAEIETQHLRELVLRVRAQLAQAGFAAATLTEQVTQALVQAQEAERLRRENAELRHKLTGG